MKDKQIKKMYLVILCIAIIVIPNLSMITTHNYTVTENTLFKGEQVYDVHLQIKNYAVIAFSGFLLIIMIIELIANKFKSFRISKRLLPLIIFGMLVVISGVTSKYQDIVWNGVFQYYESTITFLAYIIMSVAGYKVYNDKSVRKYFTYAIYCSLIIAFIQGILQYFGVNIFNFPLINKAIVMLLGADSVKLTTDTTSGILAGLDNSNFLGSFVVIPMAVALYHILDGARKIDWIIYFLSVWMLFASNSAAGSIGLIVLLTMITLIKVNDWREIVKVDLPIIFTMLYYFVANRFLDKLVLFDRNQYLIATVALILAFIVFILKKVSINKMRTVISLVLILVLGVAGICLVDSSKILADKDSLKTFSGYESAPNKLNLNKGNYTLQFSIDNNELMITEQPSGKEAIFENGTINFSNMDYFSSFGGRYDSTDAGILMNISPLDLILLFNYGNIYYQDIYEWHPITELSSASHFGLENYQHFGSGRGYIWSRTFPMLKNYVVLGSGADTYMFEYPQEDFVGKLHSGFGHFTIVDKPHNFFLRYWVQFGFLALALFLGGVIWISWEGLRKNVAVPWIIALLAVLGTGMFNDIIAGISFLIYILIGLIIGELENHKEFKKA